MNHLMGIKHDKDVCEIDCATEEDIEEFEEGATTAPGLNPMRPYLESTKRNSWNDTLCDMFVEYFEEEMGEQNMILADEDKEEVERMFLDRLARLSRPWRDNQKFTGQQLIEREKWSNARARRNTRRLDVS